MDFEGKATNENKFKYFCERCTFSLVVEKVRAITVSDFQLFLFFGIFL